MDKAYELADPCRICPRACVVHRLNGNKGFCRVADRPIVASTGPHFGEEKCLVGRGGSGTIFLSGCNLRCVFCQNYDISHEVRGEPTGVSQLAQMMVMLQGRGCENINFVTPTHVVPWLMDAVRRARLNDLTIPIVYNCGGYERVETLRLLEGTVDIYMPDMKYWDSEIAELYSDAADYPERMRESVREMHRQVGDLLVVDGVAREGLLIRHLVMPNKMAGSVRMLNFIAEEISGQSAVNVMSQYHPTYRAAEFERIARPPTNAEYESARSYAENLGLNLL